MERALQLNPIFKEEKVMVRAAEQTSTTNPVAERRFDDALEAYRGDLLAGFFVAGSSPDLYQWMEDERGHLRQLAMRAATTLASQSESAGDLRSAARWARRAVAISPTSTHVQRRGAVETSTRRR